MDKRITICETIMADMKKDAADFDGKPFTGKTMGEYMGYHGAAIAALADLLKSILEEKHLSSTPPVEESEEEKIKRIKAEEFGKYGNRAFE